MAPYSQAAGPSDRHIAIICDTVPFPTRSGDNQRIGELIQVLREQGWFVHLILCGLVERRFQRLCLSHVDTLQICSGVGLKTRLRNGLRRGVRWFDRIGHFFRLPPLEIIVGRVLGGPVSPLVIDYWQRYPHGLSEFVANLQARSLWKAVIVEYIWLHRSIDALRDGTIRLLDTHDIQYKRLEEFASRGMVFPLRIRLRRGVRWFDRIGHFFRLPPLEIIVGRVLGGPVSPLVIDYWQRYPHGLSEFVANLQARSLWKAVIVEYIWLHRSIDALRDGTIRLLDTHDIQYKRLEEFASRGMVFPLRITRDEERRIFDRFDALIAIQAAEADLIREMCPHTPVLTVGSQGGHSPSVSSPSEDGRLLYVGGYNGANIDGLRRFLHYAWPEVCRNVPGATLHVCGHIDRAFAGERFDRVTFLGHQENLDAEYAAAAVVINPAWIGTGLKIKSIEALHRGKPLVTTPKGIEGLPRDAEQSAVIAVDDESFATAIIRLLTDIETRQALSRSALAFARNHLTRDAVYRELFQFLEQPKDSKGR